MDEDPLPYKEFKKDYRMSAIFLIQLLLAIAFWGTLFAGIFLVISYAFAQYTLGGVI